MHSTPLAGAGPDLSTRLGDLSLLDLDAPLDGRDGPAGSSSPSAQQRARFSTGGLLQDEDMSLAASGLLGGDDDSFFGDEPTVRLTTIAVAGETTRSAPVEPDAEGLTTTKRELVAGVEFGGSMAASTTAGGAKANAIDLTTVQATRDGERGLTAEDGRDEDEEEAIRRRDDQDELLVLEDDDCTEEDKVRIHHLRREREELRGMNKVLRSVVASLKLTERNMNNVQAAASTSHDLLDLYSRILSQAEHTKDLILDPDWRGLEADEDYLLEQQQAALAEQERQRLEAEAERERVARQEQERLDRKRREEEELERRKRAPSAAGGAVRGSGRGIVRGSTTAGRGLVRGTRARPTASSASSTRGGRAAANDGSASFSSTSSGIPTYSASSASGRGSAAVSGVRGVRGLRSRGGVSGIGRGARGGSV
ncbi:hypothetical protein JCM11491_004482 [Sporobolomyces phaffii]